MIGYIIGFLYAIFIRLNAVIEVLAFLMWRLFKGGVYLEITFFDSHLQAAIIITLLSKITFHIKQTAKAVHIAI